VQRFLDDYFRANPTFAVYQGKHEYDGQFPDWSTGGIEAEIARLDPDQAAIVCAHIDSSFLDGLAEVLTHDDSLVEVPVTDLNGAPVLDSKGEQLVQFDPSDEVLVVADAVVRDVLERIFDDPELKDANWHAASGRTTVTVPTTDKLAVQAAETFEASYQADANYRSSAHGVYFTGLTLIDPEKRTVELEVKNFWLRWLSAYIDFFSPSGAVVESTAEPFQQGSLDFDIFNLQSAPGTVVRSRFVSIVGANSDFLGIPVLPEDTAATPLRFDMPPGASVARASGEPTMTASAPQAIALEMSPPVRMPPSAMTFTYWPVSSRCWVRAAEASAIAVACGTPTPSTPRVVQAAPGPTPTRTPAAPVRIRWSAAW
jgi:hypothetical protein